MSDRYTKLEIALRYYLKGAKFNTALAAMDFGLSWHKGLRKDGVTPEFQHQIEIALYCISLKGIVDEEMTITAALLHDTIEDHENAEHKMMDKFDEKVMRICRLLDKTGKKPEDYFAWIAKDSVASIVKGADRVHNVNSMVGVFTKEKQAKYVAEVEQHFLPMLKTARKNFPKQMDAYFNISHMLHSQVNLLKGV